MTWYSASIGGSFPLKKFHPDPTAGSGGLEPPPFSTFNYRWDIIERQEVRRLRFSPGQ
jgi:hypothetical protein